MQPTKPGEESDVVEVVSDTELAERFFSADPAEPEVPPVQTLRSKLEAIATRIFGRDVVEAWMKAGRFTGPEISKQLAIELFLRVESFSADASFVRRLLRRYQHADPVNLDEPLTSNDYE